MVRSRTASTVNSCNSDIKLLESLLVVRACRGRAG